MMSEALLLLLLPGNVPASEKAVRREKLLRPRGARGGRRVTAGEPVKRDAAEDPRPVILTVDQ